MKKCSVGTKNKKKFIGILLQTIKFINHNGRRRKEETVPFSAILGPILLQTNRQTMFRLYYTSLAHQQDLSTYLLIWKNRLAHSV